MEPLQELYQGNGSVTEGCIIISCITLLYLKPRGHMTETKIAITGVNFHKWKWCLLMMGIYLL